MKSLVVELLVAVLATSSLTAASDTLRVNSYRTIDVCSEDRRWLIAVSIGEVYASDSLQSFDITIGYDTSRITPTDGLSTGTLSEQMKFGDLSPFFNFAIPGEIRVGAFTITRNVKGDLPLFAVAGTYKGNCGDADTFSLPWNPSFNEEFKGTVEVFTSDTILTIATAKSDTTQGADILSDTVSIAGKDSLGQVSILIQQDAMVGLDVIETFKFSDPGLVRIDSMAADQMIDSIEVLDNGQTMQIYRRVSSADMLSLTVFLTSETSSLDTTVTANHSTKVTSPCGCVSPTKRDDVVVRSQTITTSIEEWDVHESTDLLIRFINETLEIQCSHGQPWSITIVDLLGRVVATTKAPPNTTTWLSMRDLPTGAYIVYATDGTDTQVTTLAK